MRRLIALALGLCLWASPALAFTQVAGTGTGGALSNIVFISGSGPGSAGTTTASLNAGDVWAIYMQDQNNGTRTYGCSDAFGNTWQAAPGGANQTGAGTEIWYSILTNPVASGNHASCTVSSGAGALATNVAFRPSGTAAFDTNATGQANTGTSVTVGPTPTLACPSGAANCDVCVAGAAWHSNGTTTSDATFTTTFNTGTSNGAVNAFKLVSSTTAVSYTATDTTSSNYAGALACFKDTPTSSSTYGGLTTTGAGP
jgi:hypothetical protein